jgi:hypothetical protein
MKKIALLALSCLLSSTSIFAQITPAPSPGAAISQVVGVTKISIDYSRPSLKGREIFGNLVPYGKLWRTGANEATEITFTTNIQIGETALQAGTYTLFSIPNKDKWTIILNSELGQWGDFAFDASKNILTYEATVSSNTDVYEGFTIQFEDVNNGFNMLLLWDALKVTIPIQKVGDLNKSLKKNKRRN